MCGIIGCFNCNNAFEVVKEGVKIIKERGLDGSGYFEGNKVCYGNWTNWHKTSSKNIIAHVLHAIVNNIKEPLVIDDSSLVANCEIYNWKELCEENNIQARNDAELLLKMINKFGIEETLKKIKGDYTFCYWKGNDVFLVRDIIGVKPLWFSSEKGLAFCSEKKGLSNHFKWVEELNPRKIIKYSLKEDKLEFINRPFFKISSEFNNEEIVLPQLKKYLFNAVKIRIPEVKFGVLFSGGVDSILIAKLLKDIIGNNFECYVAAVSKNSLDLIRAQKAAKALDLKLNSVIIDKNDVEVYLKKVVPLIEDSNVVKVSVGLTIYVASEKAKKDGIKVLFSGLGAEELFAGYHRYKKTEYINEDCYSDLLKMYEKNTYRDDVVTMNNSIELRLPFLDLELINFAFKIDASLKIKKINDKLIDKYILRQLAIKEGIPEEFALAKKKAAQYGSGFNKIIKRLAEKSGFKLRSEYLKQFYNFPNLRLGALVSGGKDSLYAAYIMHKQNYELSCFITLLSENKDSYMFHTPNVEWVKLQAKASNIPLVTYKTLGEKEKELEDLEAALKIAKEKYHIEGVITGALFSNYQRSRIETLCEKLGLKVFSPLWHMDPQIEMNNLLTEDFKFIFSSVASMGLNKEWLGREIERKDIALLSELSKKYKLNVAGEGGEFESFVIDCPLFKEKIKILDGKIIEDKGAFRFHIKKAILSPKVI